jgi:tRNA-binding protein
VPRGSIFEGVRAIVKRYLNICLSQNYYLGYIIPTTMELSWEEFQKVEMRVGTILEASDFPEARKPSYKLRIDFGNELGIKKSSAQITNLYTKEDLVGKQVIAVVNFPKKQIGPFMSECLVLGAVQDTDVTLLEPNKPVRNGLRIS